MSETFLVTRSKDTRDILVELSRPAVVEGVVKGGDGEPIPGARVWLRDDILTGGVIEVLTDRTGRYRFVDVAPGLHYHLELHVRGKRKRNIGEGGDEFEVEPGKRVEKNLETLD